MLYPHDAEVTAAAHPPTAEAGSILRVFADPNTPLPEVHLLSNGRYHVMLDTLCLLARNAKCSLLYFGQVSFKH